MPAQTLENPISADSIAELFASILSVVIIISIPIVVFFLIYAGFLYVTAGGKPEQIKKASQSLLYGVFGAVIILAAVAILEIVKNIVGAF